MPYKDTTDIRIRCRQRYINDGITNFSTIAELEGTTRQSVSKWAKEEKWADQRASQIITPDALAAHYRRLLASIALELEEKQSNNLPIADSELKKVASLVKTLRTLDADFDVRGNVVYFWKQLVQYLSLLPDEKKLVEDLRRVYPGFMTFIENQL